MYDTELSKYIDFMWQTYKMQIILFNSTYVVYPIIIGFLLAFTNDGLHDNWQWALAATMIPTTIEII